MGRLYGLLARVLLPTAFLEVYGTELIRTVAARLSGAPGIGGRVVLFLRELADLLQTAAREWWIVVAARRTHRAGRGDRAGLTGNWLADVRFSVRRLRTRPGYALLSILTLALGVAGTAAIHGIARGLLFDPLPYATEREIGVWWKTTDWTEEEFLFLRGRAPGFQSVALYRVRDALMREGRAPARLLPGVVSSVELFDVLGTRPILGRGFLAGEDQIGAEAVAVLSYGLWQELGGDAGILGTRLTIDGAPRTVVGVMPAGFWFPDPSVRLWMTEPLSTDARSWNSTLIGRVATGLDVHAMAAPIAQLTSMLDDRFDYPAQWDKTTDARITPIRDEIAGSMRPALLATLAAMALILLLACANIAALMLGQVDARSTEFAVRLALGANRRRLTRQLIVEALLLALAAGALGALFAWRSFDVLSGVLPIGVWSDAVAPDWTVFATAIALAMGAALLVVLVPMTALWRRPLRGALRAARTGGLQRRGDRLENGLVVTEVALAVLIAFGALLLARSVSNLYALEPGLRTEDVGVVAITMGGNPGGERQRQIIDDLAVALAAMHGVRSAAASQVLPLRGGGYNLILGIEGRPDLQGASTEYRIITPGYLETMGIELRNGRSITPMDRSDTEPVVVINEALAARYFDGSDPIGQRLGDLDGRFLRVVGVVANAAERRLTDTAEPVRYVALAQMPWVDLTQSLVFRAVAGVDPVTLLGQARQLVEHTAPEAAVRETTTMSRVLDGAVGPARQVMTLLSLLTTLALTLGAVGVYGVIAHFAARRRRDWAIRVALGLSGARVIARVIGHGAVLVIAGIAIGVLAGSALARLLGSLLYDVTPLDPLALAMASAVLLSVGVLACLTPAIRAGLTDPMVALREE